MLRIAHISDLHFGVDKNQSEQFKYLCKSIAAAKPDVIVCSGDIIDCPGVLPNKRLDDAHAKMKELCDLCELSMDSRFFITPGNHDIWYKGIGSGSLTKFLTIFGSFFRRDSQDGAWGKIIANDISLAIVCINTTPKRRLFDSMVYFAKSLFYFATFNIDKYFVNSSNAAGWARGYVENSELEQLTEFVARIRAEKHHNPLILVNMHHHPLSHPEKSDQRLYGASELNGVALENAGVVLERLQANEVDLVLHGHKHTPFVAEGPCFFSDAQSRRKFCIVSCGTSCHPKDRPSGKLTWNLVTVDVSGAVHVNLVEGEGTIFKVAPLPVAVRTNERWSVFKRKPSITVDEFGNARTTLQLWVYGSRSGDVKIPMRHRSTAGIVRCYPKL